MDLTNSANRILTRIAGEIQVDKTVTRSINSTFPPNGH